MFNVLFRFLCLYFFYWVAKIKYLGKVRFKGFSIVFAFPGCSIEFEGKGHVVNNYTFSNPFGLWQRSIFVAQDGGRIKIGEGSGISGSTFFSMAEINIGKNVLVGGNCKIIDNDFHPLHFSKRHPQKMEDIKRKSINIGDECFIGAGSIILKGTTLGKNCVVGAGSVVSGNWPDNSIIAGNPAKFLRNNELEECVQFSEIQ